MASGEAKIVKYLLCIVGLSLSLLSLRADPSQVPDARIARTLPYTSRLPDADRVEVDHLTIDQVGHITGTTGTRHLDQDNTAQLVKLWRQQTYGFHYSSGCHLPGFSVRFYQQKKLIAEETICFTCGSILFRHTDLLDNLGNPGWQGFDKRTAAAINLLTFLKNLFPEIFNKPA